MEQRQFDSVLAPSETNLGIEVQKQRDEAVRHRLEQTCTPDEVDLLYRMIVEGVSASRLARELGCHRATPARRLNRLLGRLRQDPKLQGFAVSV